MHIFAITSRSKINMSDFEPLLHEQIIREWRCLDQIHPYDAHVSSRVMRTYHTHFGVPLGTQTGWWDDQKRTTKPTLPSYLRHRNPKHLLRALSRLSGHNLTVERLVIFMENHFFTHVRYLDPHMHCTNLGLSTP